MTVAAVDRVSTTFGLMTPTLFASEPCDMERLKEAAAIADDSEIDILWAGDHLLWRVPILDVTVVLGVLAGHTRRVRLGTNILQLPLRQPVLVAKAFATLSYLTGGRVVLGVGVGGEYEAEWVAAGVDHHERGRRCNEALVMLRRLWAGDEEHGSYYNAPGVPLEPQPANRIPIWIGGRSDAAYARAAGQDGFLGYLVTPDRFDEVRARILDLRSGSSEGFEFGMQLMARIERTKEEALDIATTSLAKTYGGEPTRFKRYVAAGTPEQVAEFVQAYIDRGLTHASFFLHGPNWLERARRLCTDVLPLLSSRNRAFDERKASL